MIWIAPSEKDTATDTLEKRLWDAADQFRANSGRKPQEYSGPSLVTEIQQVHAECGMKRSGRRSVVG